MNEPRFESRRKLTGVWQGLYTYPDGGPHVPFTATLIEAGHTISGSIHEPCVGYGNPSETLYATLVGTRHESVVSFVKTYDGAHRNFGTVNYEGAVNDEASEIEGRWTIRADWSGKFLMIRSGDAPVAAVERKSAEVSGEAIPEFTGPAGPGVR